jgi:hypothetical protein
VVLLSILTPAYSGGILNKLIVHLNPNLSIDKIEQCAMAVRCAKQYIEKFPDLDRVTAKFTENQAFIQCIMFNDAKSIIVFGTKK